MSQHETCKIREAVECSAAVGAADEAVKKVFAILGVDINKPESVEAFREDLRFGGRLRRAADHGFLAMIAAVSVGALAIIWVGITTKLGGGH